MLTPRYAWYDEPLRGTPPIACLHCGKEIAAAATDERTVSVNGVYGHVWYHVSNDLPWCAIPPPAARPADPFLAENQIWHAKRQAS